MIRCLAAGLIALAAAAGCTAGGPAGQDAGELHVFAASSLTEAFADMADQFEDDHVGLSVRLTFGGSGALARQIGDGAEADVFAAADEVAMESVREAVGPPVVIARNQLVIVVEPGNPKGIQGLAGLSGDVVVVLCAPEVPCGRYAKKVLRRAGVSVRPASLEENVKAVVAKVALGEADAGIVYATDALAAGGEVARIDLPARASFDSDYSMAVVGASDNTELADDWVSFVLSSRGQEILGRHGFLAP